MKASSSRKLARPAEEVWGVAGRFNGLPDISSMTHGSELLEGGRVRKLTPDGSHPGYLLERLVHYDDAARRFSYVIDAVNDVPGMAYGVGYRGTLHIKDDVPGESCVYTYSAEFEPLAGVSEEQARAAVDGFVQDCIDGVCRILGISSERD